MMSAVEVLDDTVSEDTIQNEVSLRSSEARVFQNEMLLDKILKFAINDGDTMDSCTANHCKLVNTLWLDRVCVTLSGTARPLIYLDTEPMDKLRKFTATFRDAPAYRIPFFELRIAPINVDFESLCTPEDLNPGLECFTHELGERLVNLKVGIGVGRWIETAGFINSTPFCLPNLQKFEMCERGLIVPDIEDSVYSKMVQTILAAAEHCKCLILHLNEDNFKLDINIENMRLASSLEEIHLTNKGRQFCRLLHSLFFKNARFPNLTSLTIKVETLKEDGLKDTLFNILNLFRHQLKKLQLYNGKSNWGETIRVPVMACVEELNGTDWTCERSDETSPMLQTCFPLLKTFRCNNSTKYDSLLDWVEPDGKSLSVNIVDVQLKSLMGTDAVVDETLLTKISRVHFTFPNITHLKLFLHCTTKLFVLKYIFQNMYMLQELEVTFLCRYRNMNPDIFNAVLLGIDLEDVADLRGNVEMWTDIKEKHVGRESIANLTDLRKLHFLSGLDLTSHFYLDMAAKFGLSRMSNLVDLSFSEKFSF